MNQRSDKWVLGMVSVFSGVKATAQTISNGASMKAITQALKARAKGLFFAIA